jgi:hypothetical protein
MRVKDRYWFFTSDLAEWIEVNISHNMNNNESIRWATLRASGCHALWQWRNKDIHVEAVTSYPTLGKCEEQCY